MMFNDLVKECQEKYSRLKNIRANFEKDWEDIATYIIPDRMGFSGTISPGSKTRRQMLDGIGEWSSNQLINFVHGATTNPASVWFRMSCYDEKLANKEANKQYLEYATNHLYSIFNNPKKKFYDNSHELYSDMIPFGTGLMYLENIPGNGLSFRSRFLKECYIDENYDNIVDTVCREFTYTLQQIVQKFGRNVLTTELDQVYEKQPSREFTVLHCIFPREDREYGSLLQTNKPYASIHLLQDSGIILSNSGFDRFPVIAARWTKRSNEVYGRGPGSVAIASVRMLQGMKGTTLKGGQKMVDPPLQAPDNTFLSPMNLTPGFVNYYNPIMGSDGAKQIITNSRPDFGIELIKEEKEAIKQAFFVDRISDQKNPNVEQTRTEYVGNQNQNLMFMAPQLGRIQSEYLGPLIEQTYFIEVSSGRLDPPPDDLKGKDILIQYKGPLAKAQQLARLNDVTGAIQTLVPLSSAFPEVMDPIDPDKLVNWVFQAYDTPPSVIKPEQEVKKLREQRKQQMEMQAQLEQAKLGSESVRNVAQLMPKGSGQRAIN